MSSGSNYALMELADSIGQAARRTLDASDERKRMEKLQREYAAAMALGAQTGQDMPNYLAIEAEQLGTLDCLTRQAAIKTVALRELAKFCPLHPLVVSQVARIRIGDKAIMKLSAARRSMDRDLNSYAPNDEEAQEVFAPASRNAGK